MFEKNKTLQKNKLAIINLDFPDPQDIFKIIPTNFKDNKKYIGRDYIIIKDKKIKVNLKNKSLRTLVIMRKDR